MLIAVVGVSTDLAPVIAAVISLEIDAQTLIASSLDAVPPGEALLLIVDDDQIAGAAGRRFPTAAVVSVAAARDQRNEGPIDAGQLLWEIVRALPGIGRLASP